MFMNQIKTAFLLGAMSGLLLLLGHFAGGSAGLTIALTLAIIMNFVMYFYSDKIVLKLYKAQPLDGEKYGPGSVMLRRTVQRHFVRQDEPGKVVAFGKSTDIVK